MKFLRRLYDDEPMIYGGVLIVVVGLWIFIAVAKDVSDGQTQSIDDQIVRSLRQADDPSQPIGPKWVAEIARDMTALGGYAVLLLVLFSVTGFLLLSGRQRMTDFMWGAVLSGYFLSMGLKMWFQRPRPSIVPHLSYVETSSFPSGHSMMSAVVYLTLGALLARVATTRRLKLYSLLVPLVISGLVGASRVYMGVHYPSDILAGWSAGLVWATVCWIVAQILEQRGVIRQNQRSSD